MYTLVLFLNARQIMYWYHCWHPIDHIAVVPYLGLSAEHLSVGEAKVPLK